MACILDLLGTSVTLLQNVEDLVNLVTHIEGFSDGRMSIIEKTTVLDGLRSIYAIAGDVAGYVPLVGPLLSIPFDVGEKAVGFVQEVTDKIFARYFDYLKLEVLIRINAVGSDGNPIGTFGKGDRLAINGSRYPRWAWRVFGRGSKISRSQGYTRGLP